MFEKIKNKIKLEEYTNKMGYPKKPEGYKKENYIYNENQSVKWNKEHQIELTNQYIEELMNFQEETNRLQLEFREQLIASIMIEFNFNKELSKYVYSLAWDERHSEGLESVVDEAIKKAEEFTESIALSKLN